MEIINWTIYEPDYAYYKYRINDGKQHSIEKEKLKEYLDSINLIPSQLQKVFYCIDTFAPFILYEYKTHFDFQELTYKQSPDELRKEMEIEMQSKQSIIKKKEEEKEKEDKPSLIEKISKKILFDEDIFDE